MNSVCRILLTLLLASLPTATWAAAVVHGPEVPAEEALARAAAATGRDDLSLRGPASSLIPGDEGEVLAHGATVERCAAEPGVALEKLLLDVRSRIDDMEYGSAMATLTEAADRLPCDVGGASADQLYDLFFLHGLSAFNEGHETTARKRFAQAAVMAPSRKWDNRYPPTAKPLYLEALQEALAGRQVPVHVLAPGITVDGTALTPDQPTTLLAGGHLVQLGQQTAWVELPAAGSVSLSTVAAARAGLGSGDARFSPWLADLGPDSLLVTADAVLELRAGVLVPVSQPQAASASQPSPLMPIGAVLAGSGGALLGVGLGLNIASYNEGQPAPEDNLVHVNQAHYEELVVQNQAGLALAITGGALAATGAALIVVSKVKGGEPLAWAPWLVVEPGAVAFGVGGVLP